ncbi:MAG: restriction endonuclease [Lachnospiraceae bacterium]|jgi:restriction endonuclease Mrr|nr:restriction endonuclease [Lachnospiraceae bacterium]
MSESRPYETENGLLEDITVAKKLVEILDILFGEGAKAQVERMLVSEIEDMLEERTGQALDDKLYIEQYHKVRDALMAKKIISYDTKTYRLLKKSKEQVLEKDYQDALAFIKVENKETLETKKKTENNKTPSFDIATQTEEFRAYVLSLLRTMKPFEFERLTTQLLRACGLEFYPGRRTGDDGVDGYGYITVAGLFKFKVLVQCKRYQESTKIANYAIRDLRGAVSTDAYKGLFVTTSSFSPRAKEEANKFPQIDLIDGRQFVDLMIEKKIGVVEENGTYSMKKDYLEHIQL